MTDRFGNISIDPDPPGPSSHTPHHKPSRVRKRAVKISPSPKRHNSKAGILTFALFSLVSAIYLFAGYWGVPKYIQSSLPEKFQRQTGLTLQLGQVQFDPFRFNILVDDIIITDQNHPLPLLFLKSLVTDLAAVPLLKGEFVTTHILAKELQLNLIRNQEGQFNYQPLFQGKDTKSQSDILDFSDLPFLFSFNNIAIQNGTVRIKDKPNDSEHIIENLELQLPNLSNFSFSAKEYIHPSFSAVINGSPIQLKGKATLSGGESANTPHQTELECDFKDIDLSRYFAYLPLNLPFEVSQGMATGTLKLTFDQASKENKLSIYFNMQAQDTISLSNQKSHFLTIPTAMIEGSILPSTRTLHFINVTLRNPVLRSTKTDSAGKEPIADRLKSTQSVQRLLLADISADSLIVDNGTYIELVGENEKVIDRWETIQVSLKNYSSSEIKVGNSNRSSFRLSAEQSNTTATLNFHGSIGADLLPAGDLHIKNFPTERFFRFTGIPTLTTSTGNVDAKAFIHLKKGRSGSEYLSTIKEGSVKFYDLSLMSDNSTWFSSPVTKITGFSKQGNHFNLGTIESDKLVLNILTDNLPSFLSSISKTDNEITLDALDVQGSLTLSQKLSSIPQIVFSDFKLHAINLNKSEKSNERDNLSFTANVGKDGSINAKGKVQIKPLSINLDTRFTNIESVQLLPWFSSNPLLEQLNTRLEGSGDFTFPDISFTGELSMHNGHLTDQDRTYLTWDHLTLPDLRYSQTPLHLGGSRIDFTSPRLQYIQTNESGHPISILNNFFQRYTPAKHSDPEKTTIVPKIDFQEIHISSGEISLQDNRLSPVWTGHISDFDGTLQNFTSNLQASQTLFSFTGLLDSVPFEVHGANHFFNPRTSGDSDFTIEEYPLPSFYKQLSTEVDIDPSHGNVTARIKSNWEGETLRQESELHLANVVPGTEDSTAALTLALISDAENEFILSSSTERSLTSSPSSIFSDAVTTFQKLVFKATVSPFLLATGDFSELIGKEYAEFLPGQIILSGEGRESLSRFSRFLSAHPHISLTITGSADWMIDGESLKNEMNKFEQQRVTEENERREVELEIATEKYIQQQILAREAAGLPVDYIEQEIPPELFKQYEPITPVPVVIDEAMLKDLADRRASVIFDFFTEKLALQAERVRLSETSTIARGENGAANRVSFTIGTYSPSDPFNSPIPIQQ